MDRDCGRFFSEVTWSEMVDFVKLSRFRIEKGLVTKCISVRVPDVNLLKIEAIN